LEPGLLKFIKVTLHAINSVKCSSYVSNYQHDDDAKIWCFNW